MQVTAPTREEALEGLRRMVSESLTSGHLVPLQVPMENPLLKWFGHARDDPEFAEYLEEVRRYRQEVDAKDQPETGTKGCSGSSSTPTT
jgi:hypothetical protein